MAFFKKLKDRLFKSSSKLSLAIFLFDSRLLNSSAFSSASFLCESKVSRIFDFSSSNLFLFSFSLVSLLLLPRCLTYSEFKIEDCQIVNTSSEEAKWSSYRPDKMA